MKVDTYCRNFVGIIWCFGGFFFVISLICLFALFLLCYENFKPQNVSVLQSCCALRFNLCGTVCDFALTLGVMHAAYTRIYTHANVFIFINIHIYIYLLGLDFVWTCFSFNVLVFHSVCKKKKNKSRLRTIVKPLKYNDCTFVLHAAIVGTQLKLKTYVCVNAIKIFISLNTCVGKRDTWFQIAIGI